MTDTLIRIGQKAVINDEGQVDGWLAPFDGPVKGGKDLDGEYFSPDTDFALDYYPSIPIIYAHGQDGEIKATKVGDIPVKDIRDKGLWVQGQLDRQGKYYDVLRELADKGDLYWSSGAISHLVTKDARTGAIKQWPVAEATLTLTPANPWATASVKEAAETVTEANPTTYTISWTLGDDATKEGRRNSSSDAALVQTMHDHAVALGATCAEPDADEAAGKEADKPPAYVLTVKAGDDAEQPSTTNLDAVKAMADEIAITRARQLTG